MNVFDEMERTETGPQRETESLFSFVNRSARPQCDLVRNLIQQWFNDYAKEEQSELRARLRSDNGDEHLSAFTELLLFELHRLHGCAVAVHPHTSAEDNRTPDSLVDHASGTSYLEARLVTCRSDKDRAADARRSVVRDAINAIESPDYGLVVEESGKPRSPPSIRAVRDFIEQRFATLDYELLRAQALRPDAVDRIPKWRYVHDGWEVVFSPFPRSPGSRGKPGGRLIGATMQGMVQINTWEPIRNAIIKKAGKYKGIDLPFVLALNVLDELEDIDIMDALFGREQFTFRTDISGDPVPSRQPNGAWRDKSGPINTRVSTVLLMQHVTPWNLDRTRVLLFHNPWAIRPYSGLLTALTQEIPQRNDTIEERAGKHLHEMLGIRSQWLNQD